jgi:hypothetical protein
LRDGVFKADQRGEGEFRRFEVHEADGLAFGEIHAARYEVAEPWECFGEGDVFAEDDEVSFCVDLDIAAFVLKQDGGVE